MRYPVALHKEEGSDYGVTVPDIPGCFSAGKTMDEALENAEEAILVHLQFLAEDNDPIPHADTIERYRKDPAFNDVDCWGVVSIDVTPFLGKAEKINITIPRLLLKQIDEYVARHESAKSRSGFLSQLAFRELASNRELD